MTPPTTLGAVIRARRLELGLTQEALAERIDPGFRQSDVSRLERDCIALPRRQRLEAIAAALEMSVGQLLLVSGWAGIDPTAFEQAERQMNRAGAPSSAFSSAPPTVTHAKQVEPTNDVVRLRVAMRQARDVRASAADLLRRLRDCPTARAFPSRSSLG